MIDGKFLLTYFDMEKIGNKCKRLDCGRKSHGTLNQSLDD
jgi:hypothetical protein